MVSCPYYFVHIRRAAWTVLGMGLLWVAPVLVVRPTDVRAVRGIGVLLCCAFTTALWIGVTLKSSSCNMGGGTTLHEIKHYMHQTTCWSLNIWVGGASVFLCLSAPLGVGFGVVTSFDTFSPVPSSSGGVTRSARTIALVARVTPRKSLQQSRHLISAWLLLTTLLLSIGTIGMIYFQATEGVQGPADPVVMVGLVLLLLPAAAMLVSCRRLRGASQWWLGMHGVFDETAATATLFVLVGTSFRLALQDARRRFRALSGDELLSGGVELFCHPSLRVDLAPAAPGAQSVPLNSLQHPKARQTALGEVDAFLSHSSQDAAEELLEAFRGWTRDFVAATGRDSLVWLDTMCLDEKDFRGDITRLPIFIAGCKQLVLLVGDTFCTRFWCVMELIAFVETGGRLRDVMVLPLRRPKEPEPANLQQLFEAQKTAIAPLFTFEVKHATCHLPSDMDALLTAIESGFGSHAAFNIKVRRTSLALLRTLRERARQGSRAANEARVALESSSAMI